MEDKKKKYVVIGLIVCILLLIFFLIFVLGNSLKRSDSPKTTTTKTTVKKENILKDSNVGISINYDDTNEIKDSSKLVVKKVNDNIDIENLISVYDINIVDKNNNIVKVNNTKLKISIPFDNSLNYNTFKVLYLDDGNVIKETINATYNNGNVIFYVNHLSRYAIVATKEENTTTTSTTTKKQETTTKKNVVNTTTVKQNETTRKQETTTKKQETTTTKKTTTKQPTTTSTTTTTTTTKKVKTYSYIWGSEKDAAGQQYLYIVDNDGNKVSGTVLVSYNQSSYSETVSVSTSGVLLIKDIVTISNVKGN